MTVLTMLTPTAALAYERERRAWLLCTHLRSGRVRTQSHPMRRWVGRQLVRAGAWLANDPTLRPVRAR